MVVMLVAVHAHEVGAPDADADMVTSNGIVPDSGVPVKETIGTDPT